LAASVAVAALLAHAFLLAPFAVRGFRRGLADRWSTLACTIALMALAGVVWAYGAAAMPLPYLGAVAAAAVVAPVATVVFTVGGGQRLLDRLPAWLHPPHEAGQEERRKLPHLAMGLSLAGYLGVGHGVAVLLRGLQPELAASAALPWAHAGQQLVVAWFLVLVLVLAPVEVVRLWRPDLPYPWKRILESRMRPREHGLVMAHMHMAVGAALAVLWLGHDPERWEPLVHAAMATIAVSVFADTASALVGTRWGRAKWPHSPGKSVAGTAAGLAVAFVVALPFTGVPLAVAAALLFVAIDLVAPAWVPVSDNLLNPVGLAAFFWLAQGWLAPLA
jgi:dolichol kinase